MTTRTRTVPTAAGYRPRRTLPLRVEALRQLRRRRTFVAFVILLGLPWVLVAAFLIGGEPTEGGRRINLVDVATQSALNFGAFCVFVSAGFLLVVAVALFCGDTVASEANWASLRYLLAAPVPRSRLLWQKLVVALAFAAAAILVLPLMGLVAGTVAFGWGDLVVPGTGITIPAFEALGRLGIVILYTMISSLVVAALAFLLSVATDSPLGAVGGAVGLVIVSNILDAVTALGDWREAIPVHWQFAWVDAMQPEIAWEGMLKGGSVSVAYALVLFAWAFRRFRTKDIVS
ncbi:MAG: ABC transporter permease subunit [Streptosporangiales bacterium]|nr:ABC transporter permease subunit [Streptosporangiales bacterium]